MALWRNMAGPVLFSTTRPERGAVAAEGATQSVKLSDAEAAAFSDLAATAQLARSGSIRTS